MKSKPQGRFEGSLFGRLLKTRLAVIASNWVFQGMRYMTAYEVFLKLGLNVVFVIAAIGLTGIELNLHSVLFLFLFAHSLNWLLNGHFFVLMRYVAPVPKTPEQFESFVADLHREGEKIQSIDSISIYGSYCRKELHKFSDLDVRVMTSKGLYPGLVGAVFCFYMRFKAFFLLFPLDVYSCNSVNFLSQLRDDEIPIVLFDRSGALESRYPR